MSTTNSTDENRRFTAVRLAMVKDQLQSRDITDSRILQAMGEVPRHRFISPEWRFEAYSDRPLPIGEGQTISQPYMVAFMLQALELRSDARVLEVGTGSGYQAAILSQLVPQVYSMEYFPALAERARTILQQLSYRNVQVIVGDGSLGLPQYAPYNGIIVAAAAPSTPRALLDQLAEGGRLAIPVGDTTGQDLLIIHKHGTSYTEERSIPCRFVPLLGKEGWHEPK